MYPIHGRVIRDATGLRTPPYDHRAGTTGKPVAVWPAPIRGQPRYWRLTPWPSAGPVVVSHRRRVAASGMKCGDDGPQAECCKGGCGEPIDDGHG
jgi:hypothetical protein